MIRYSISNVRKLHIHGRGEMKGAGEGSRDGDERGRGAGGRERTRSRRGRGVGVEDGRQRLKRTLIYRLEEVLDTCRRKGT